jgi:hypothetical protein
MENYVTTLPIEKLEVEAFEVLHTLLVLHVQHFSYHHTTVIYLQRVSTALAAISIPTRILIQGLNKR